ncbi:MAG: hypothetical protein HGA25_06865 [Clostridiales bacterium]|nr:hypothetical protein [Clostridiales bacterium]
MKKKLLLMSIAGGLIMTTIIGGTLAATSIRSQTLTTQAQITVDNLAISLGTGENEAEYYTVSEISDEELGNSVVLPNSDIEYNQLVYNDGDYPVYIRVVLEKSWMGEFGNESQPDSSYIELLYNEEDWFAFTTEYSTILYYRKPVEIGGNTSQILDAIHLSPAIDEAYSGAQISISARAEAVQSYDAQNSIPSEWGVFPTFNGTTIESVSE